MRLGEILGGGAGFSPLRGTFAQTHTPTLARTTGSKLPREGQERVSAVDPTALTLTLSRSEKEKTRLCRADPYAFARACAITSRPSKIRLSTSSKGTDMCGAIFQPAPPVM
jgi:hypothetical protein